MVEFSNSFFSQASCYDVVLQPHNCIATTVVWALPRSLATTRGIINLFSLPRGTKMFQFPRFALRFCVVTALQTAGLSHSEILGSKIICIYPRLIAAYHVLHRLREPRHPPCALFYFLRIFRAVVCSENRSSYFQLLLCFLTYSFACNQYVKDRFLTTLILYKVENGEKFGLEPMCMPVVRLSLFPYFVRQCNKKLGEKSSKPFA